MDDTYLYLLAWTITKTVQVRIIQTYGVDLRMLTYVIFFAVRSTAALLSPSFLFRSNSAA